MKKTSSRRCSGKHASAAQKQVVYRVKNWAAYDQALVQRGRLDVWVVRRCSTLGIIRVRLSAARNSTTRIMHQSPGSHHMGRVDHHLVGGQTGADLEVVAATCERLELVYCELEPGDALFFHCNLLHRSDQPRWSLICCYNAARNDPFKDSHHPRYSPLARVADSAIVETGIRRFQAGDEA